MEDPTLTGMRMGYIVQCKVIHTLESTGRVLGGGGGGSSVSNSKKGRSLQSLAYKTNVFINY